MNSTSDPTPADARGPGGGTTVIVLVGGDDSIPHLDPFPPGDVHVIAADSGLHLAEPLGLDVDLVVGDLDSVDPEQLDAAVDTGARVDRHPVHKDRTDLAIALDAAVTFGAADVLVVGGHGGRLDHLLGGLSLLAAPDYASMRITARMGPATVTVIRGETLLRGTAGDLVSLVPIHGTAHGVSTQGLRYPLTDETLPAGSSRGVSNVFTGPVAVVRPSAGVLLAIQPGPATPPHRSTDDGERHR